MRIHHLAAAAVLFSLAGSSSGQVVGKSGAPSAKQEAARSESRRRLGAELQRLKERKNPPYVDSLDLAVDPRSRAGQRIAILGYRTVPASTRREGLFRVAHRYGAHPFVPVDASRLPEGARRQALDPPDFPARLCTVEGVWRYREHRAGGGVLVAESFSDLGEAAACGSAEDCAHPPAPVGEAEIAGFRRRVSAELSRLQAETPRRYVENASFAAGAEDLRDRQVILFGFGFLADVRGGVFTFRIGDKFGAPPSVVVDFSGLPNEKKKALLRGSFPPHLWTVEGTWKSGAGAGYVAAEEVRDLGEPRSCASIADCLKDPAPVPASADGRVGAGQ